jgi:hypothetical protein
MKIKVTEIMWDVDSEENPDLPEEMEFEILSGEDADDFEIEETLSELISDETGWCHNGFKWERTIND